MRTTAFLFSVFAWRHLTEKSSESEFARIRQIVRENFIKIFVAEVPDLPGCIATGATVDEVEALIREAIEIHIEGMREDNLPMPPSIAQTRYVEIESNARMVAAQP